VRLVSRSLRLKVSLGVCLVLIGLLAPLNWLQYERQRRAAMADMQLLAASAGVIAEHSLEQAMLANDRRAIQGIVDSVAASPGVWSVYLLNTRAVVAASSEGTANGQQMDRNSATCQPCHRYPAAQRPHSVMVSGPGGQPIFRTMVPVRNRPACRTCHSPQNKLNGVFYLDFSMTELNQRLARELRSAFLGSVAIITLSILVVNILLHRLVLTPMEGVVEALSRFRQGEHAVRVTVRTEDEVGTLSEGFNQMADTLQAQEVQAKLLYAELKEKEASRRQLLARLITVQEDEHRRIARELHDQFGQALTALASWVGALRSQLPRGSTALSTQLDRVEELASDTLEQMRQLALELRPPALDQLGLIPAIRHDAERRLLPQGVRVTVKADGVNRRYAAKMETALFRIAQEAITNISLHAQAQQVVIALTQRDGHLQLVVEDDGRGFDPQTFNIPDRQGRGLGLLGMQERAAAFGGQVSVISQPGQGSRVEVTVPLRQEEAVNETEI